MGVVKVIPYVNRLAKAIAAPGGKRVGDAVADANANLMTIKEPCLEALDVLLAQIGELSASRDPDATALNQMYEHANEAIGIAGVFGLPDLGKAAYSLCELIDSRPPGHGVGRRALDVHIDSLRLLRTGDIMPEPERAAMVAGLVAVVDHAKRTSRLATS